MVIGLGLVNKDIVAVVPEWRHGGKFEASRLFEQAGGPVPVALATMARLGLASPPILLSVLGDDGPGDDIVRWLSDDGLQMSQIVRAPGVATSVSVAMVDARDGSRTLANYAEALPPLTLTAEGEALLARATLLHLDGRDLPASRRAAEIVSASGGLVSLDLGTMRPGREALFPLCDYVIASQKGGAGAFPDVVDDPREQARRFLCAGVRRVAGVTLGEHGVVIAEPGSDPIHLPAITVSNVTDTNGAGDVFHGAFLSAVLNGQSPIEAAEFAQRTAARRILYLGNAEFFAHLLTNE